MRQLKSLLLCATVVALVAGCASATSSTLTVTGTTLMVYASLPSSVTGAQAKDVFDAEQLALNRSGASVGKFTIKLKLVDANKPSDNARTAIRDTSAIAYLGEIEPGASVDSMGITEDQDLLQVSPTDTAIAETQSTPAVAGAPKSYYEAFSSYGRTFARVVPSGAAEAQAQVQEMRALGVKKLYVADDGSDYGKAIAYAVRQDGSSPLSAVAGPATSAGFSSSGADGLFFGASPSSSGTAAKLFADVASSDPSARLFAPSALDSSQLASSIGSGKLSLYASQPGFLAKDLPSAADSQFIKPFEAAYGHPPATEAIFGYEAMSALLAVLREAGSQAGNHATVVHDFFHIKNRASVLGTYSIDSDGDTSIAPFVFSRFQKGAFVPYKFVQASP